MLVVAKDLPGGQHGPPRGPSADAAALRRGPLPAADPRRLPEGRRGLDVRAGLHRQRHAGLRLRGELLQPEGSAGGLPGDAQLSAVRAPGPVHVRAQPRVRLEHLDGRRRRRQRIPGPYWWPGQSMAFLFFGQVCENFGSSRPAEHKPTTSTAENPSRSQSAVAFGTPRGSPSTIRPALEKHPPPPPPPRGPWGG